MLVGAGELDALDFRRRYQPRDVLRVGPPLDALAQIVGDARGDEFEGQRAAVMLAIEPDDVEAVARRDRRLAQLTGRERDERLFKLGRGLSGRDLAEIAALRRRRTARMQPRQRRRSAPVARASSASTAAASSRACA